MRIALQSLTAVVTLAFFLLVVPGCGRAAAQSPEDMAALKKEIEALKASQAAMQRDIAQIKAALSGQPNVEDLVLPAGAAADMGQKSAKITMVEFSDYQCPFCGRYARDSFPQVVRDYVEAGKIRYEWRDFPLTQIHQAAFKAAEAARCAGAQGKYWPMHDRLFANQKALAPADLSQSAVALGLDRSKFDQCVASQTYGGKVQQDLDLGLKIGVNGTPTFLIGTANPDGTIRVAKGFSGAQPYESIKKMLDELLAGK